jgi:hypothetical protein
METTTVGMETADEPDFDGSAEEVAVIVTLRSLAGGLVGAL